MGGVTNPDTIHNLFLWERFVTPIYYFFSLVGGLCKPDLLCIGLQTLLQECYVIVVGFDKRKGRYPKRIPACKGFVRDAATVPNTPNHSSDATVSGRRGGFHTHTTFDRIQ